jgi:hypothetical protein
MGSSGVPRIFFREGSKNSVEDREQRERGSGGCSPLVRGSTQFANEWTPYSDYVVTDVFSTELGIRLSFVKTSEFQGGGGLNAPPPRYATDGQEDSRTGMTKLIAEFHNLANTLKMVTSFNLLVTRCTNKFNIQQLYILPALYLCVV